MPSDHQQGAASTFQDIRLAMLNDVQGSVHEQAGELASINALLPPLIHPIRHP